MIRYALKCDNDHSFESWFQNAGAFDSLTAARRITCPECGSSMVVKSLMAPKVRPSRNVTTQPETPPETQPQTPTVPAATPETPTALPDPELAREIAALKTKVETESDYVGDKFVSEARAMHLGDRPDRPIYGEAKIDEARELLEEGVPVMPLPFMPTHKTN
ncbi:DUF1178 family protein [Aliiroseovarius lamellibrachiae]|uniref:DUF1178 family protein n=1 Tax=Aliiroseovarius lamellibrachiae TaxID=1924933 RepID=UPI001BE0046D|nr:DUF1178 family protein [Aliiroseovarius lamellibrachiae]MBT2130691.1 DUF1178 family protein [Aliiroseovarius lamellibrachiae]